MEENGYETRQSSLLYVFVLFFGFDCAKNTIVVYSVLRSKPMEKCWLRNHAWCMSAKQKIVHGHGSAPLMCAGLNNQSPLLTMIQDNEK